MNTAILFKQNSPEIRQRIKDAGISVCPCAGFDGSKWLDYHVGLDAYFDVHGLGYSDETMSGEQTGTKDHTRLWILPFITSLIIMSILSLCIIMRMEEAMLPIGAIWNCMMVNIKV